MRHIPLLLLCLLLQACTQTQESFGETLQLAVMGPDDVTISDEKIQVLPYASMYLRVNEGPRIFVVLGYNEQGEQKWVTQDQAMLVTQHGRVVRTYGLTDNLQQVNNISQDPLANALQIVDGASWTRTLSWTEHGQLRQGTAISRFSRDKDTVLELAGVNVACRVYHEVVTLDALGKSWENTFWIDTTTGLVRQSKQMLSADDFSVDITLLKPAKS